MHIDLQCIFQITNYLLVCSGRPRHKLVSVLRYTHSLVRILLGDVAGSLDACGSAAGDQDRVGLSYLLSYVGDLFLAFLEAFAIHVTPRRVVGGTGADDYSIVRDLDLFGDLLTSLILLNDGHM